MWVGAVESSFYHVLLCKMLKDFKQCDTNSCFYTLTGIYPLFSPQAACGKKSIQLIINIKSIYFTRLSYFIDFIWKYNEYFLSIQPHIFWNVLLFPHNLVFQLLAWSYISYYIVIEAVDCTLFSKKGTRALKWILKFYIFTITVQSSQSLRLGGGARMYVLRLNMCCK